jgi:hypothetical protein
MGVADDAGTSDVRRQGTRSAGCSASSASSACGDELVVGRGEVGGGLVREHHGDEVAGGGLTVRAARDGHGRDGRRFVGVDEHSVGVSQLLRVSGRESGIPTSSPAL